MKRVPPTPPKVMSSQTVRLRNMTSHKRTTQRNLTASLPICTMLCHILGTQIFVQKFQNVHLGFMHVTPLLQNSSSEAFLEFLAISFSLLLFINVSLIKAKPSFCVSMKKLKIYLFNQKLFLKARKHWKMWVCLRGTKILLVYFFISTSLLWLTAFHPG